MKLENKVAIITGGSMGIGLGIVKVFLKYGAKVIILDYSDTTNAVTEELRSGGNTVDGYQVDVRDAGKVAQIVEQVKEKYGQIDVLVNNAGTIRLKPFLETSLDDRDVQFDINIKGIWNVSQAVVPYMPKGSTIVNLSSVTGPIVADPGEVAYATTKSAIQGFTKGLAAELVEQEIRVNAIQPGYIRTPLMEYLAKDNGTDPDEFEAQMAKGIPMKRLGRPEEAGELVAFLASSESSYITGQAIVLDGGSTMPESSVVSTN